MDYPYPIRESRHRDDVDADSAAALIENTYDSDAPPSYRMRDEIAPSKNPQADDPGSNPHSSGDEIVPDSRNRPVEDIEGILSRKRPQKARPFFNVKTVKKKPGKKMVRRRHRAVAKARGSK